MTKESKKDVKEGLEDINVNPAGDSNQAAETVDQSTHGNNPEVTDQGRKEQSGVSELEQKIKSLEEENKSLSDRLLRSYADFDNYRKRIARDSDEMEARANENIISALIPVLDNAHHAIESFDENDLKNEKIKGFKIILDEMMSVLGKFGLIVDKPEKVAFDPNRHEAINVMPSDEVRENHIVKLFRAGYLLKNKILRAAQVIVSSGRQGHKDGHHKQETAKHGSKPVTGDESA